MKKILVFLNCILTFVVYSQNGSIDDSFQTGTGTDNNVYVLKELADGKILVGGQFANYNGYPANGIARLLSNGSFDATFNPGTGIDFLLLDALIESDGKIVIAGQFSTYNGVARNCIARLNSDGTLDTSFNLSNNSNIQEIGKVSKQGNKYIITGAFTVIGGQQRNNVARLNHDGTLDTSFDVGFGTNSGISEHLVLNDDKIVIVGGFTSYNAVSRGRIARLNENGTLDTSFNPGLGASSGIYSIAAQNDGKYIIGGNFSTYNGSAKLLIARINADGSLDTSFTAHSGFEIIPTSIVVQNDGKIFTGGFLTSVAGGDDKYLVKLNSNGTLDTGFNTGAGFNGSVNVLSLQQDNKLLVGGWFTQYNANSSVRLVRLNNSSALSSDDFALSEIVVFPNPVKDRLFIENTSFLNETIEVSLSDLSGKLLFARTVRFSENLLVDVENYDRGMYILEVKAVSFVAKKRILKQ